MEERKLSNRYTCQAISRTCEVLEAFRETRGPLRMEEVIPLCLDILERKPVPPAVFVKHRLVTKETVDRLYPNDALIARADLELLLLKPR